MSVLTSYSVIGEQVLLSATQANNISVKGHTLSVLSCPEMDYRKILDVGPGWVAPVAETAGVVKYTPQTAAATGTTTYSFLLQQYRPDLGTMVSAMISYTAAASASVTTVNTALRAAITANPNFKVTLSGTIGTDTSITASAGYPLVYLTNMSPNGTTYLAVSVTTPGVASKGTYADLVRLGVDPTKISAGHTYYQGTFLYVAPDAGDFSLANTVRSHTLYMYATATNYAGFNTLMTSTLKGYVPAGTTANPRAIELVS